MDTRELFDRAMRGDLDAAEACLAHIKRGSFPIEKVHDLLSLTHNMTIRFSSVYGGIQDFLCSQELIWWSHEKWSCWHIRNPRRPTRTICGKEPFSEDIKMHITPKKVFYPIWIKEYKEGMIKPCGTCVRNLPQISREHYEKLESLWRGIPHRLP